MAVLAIKTETKCKLCVHTHRPEIDAWIERRSNREVDTDGVRINLEYVLEKMRGLGVENPTEENVKNHWQKHCARTADTTVVATKTAAAEALIKILSGEVTVDVNRDLDRLWAIGLAEIEARIAAGERSGITPDVLLRVAQEKTRRAHNETQADLLTALTGGIAAAFRPVKEIDAAEVIDVEIEEAA